MKIRNEISIAEVRERFNYDPETGLLSRRIAPKNHSQRLGEVVGSPGMDGYLRFRIDNKYFYVHRVIWAHHYGVWPNEIDHIDRDKANNRLANLRDVSHSQNMHNRSPYGMSLRSDSQSGVTGVFPVNGGTRFRAVIRVNRRQVYIGQFKTLQEAADARRVAKANLVVA